MNTISFFYADIHSRIQSSSSVKKLLALVFKLEGFQIENIVYVFCSDSYLFNINKKFLKHDTFTDIITFPLSMPNSPLIAELYISIERVKENAKIYNVSYQNELLRVIIHGALHLCGYNDKTLQEKREMRAKEDHYLHLFDVSREARS